MEKSKKIYLMNILVFLLICFVLWMRSLNSLLLNTICQEDGPIENTQAVLYFLSGIGFTLIFIKNTRNWWYLALALLLACLGGEEISWGQRILHIATPAWELKHNVQGEMNLHNINGMHQHIRILASLFIVAYFIIVPILNEYFSVFQKFFNKLRLPIYPIWAQMVLIIALIIMTYSRLVLHIKDFQTNEIAEILIAMGMYFFFLSEYWNTTKNETRTMNIFVYVISPISIFMGIYFGLLN
jgi:hypothetical protein